ncbi:MAG: undecaprenyl-diphosphate phosphatase [Bacteroidota bacterium]
MELLKALILGIIQGLTEFLPVSSSGHIELGKALLDFDLGENNLLFTVLLHCATVLSTMIVFRKDIVQIVKGLFKFKWNEETAFAFMIILSMIPVVLVGLLLEEQVESFFSGRIMFVGFMLWVTATLLFLTKFAAQNQSKQPESDNSNGLTGKKVGFKDALIIGIAQAIAVLPGISRSGSTIATGLLLGVDKSRIARFSFLMVLPPILGATILEFMEFDSATIGQIEFMPLVVGFLGAFISGWIACIWMINIVKKGKLIYFAIYCFIIGAIAIGAQFI